MQLFSMIYLKVLSKDVSSLSRISEKTSKSRLFEVAVMKINKSLNLIFSMIEIETTIEKEVLIVIQSERSLL